MECEDEPTKWRVHDNGVLEVPFVRGGGNMKVLHDYLFDPKFAQALWGETHPDKQALLGDGVGDLGQPEWQYHFQQMVIAKNPIKYLGEHLD